ncbi:MAG: hypothetical protein KJ799_10265 [Bacteroidetes bacterium]|nr:hypothetical protein [Bacteroidota bacterium]MBU1678339.1 hypothetical protein [Bacteroidota bacterium]MBU2507091.1 hypothetical protein [Bacteroidota bacterium]
MVKPSKILSIIYLLWLALNIYLLFSLDSTFFYKSTVYPFRTEYSFSFTREDVENNLTYNFTVTTNSYDYTEFLVYSLFPILTWAFREYRKQKKITSLNTSIFPQS